MAPDPKREPTTVPTATISRLVTYLRTLTQLEQRGVSTTSSEDLAKEAQVSAFQIRKDLAYFGRFGTRGEGYTVPTLRREIERILGLTRQWRVAIVGMGRLGEAIANYPNFRDYHFELKVLVDVDRAKVGQRVAGLEIRHPNELSRLVLEQGIDIGFITVPPQAAQDAANALVEAGIKGILNFAPTVIEVPREVHVEPVDFLAGLKRLSFYIVNPQLKEELT